MIRKLIQAITGRFWCWNEQEPENAKKCSYQCEYCKELLKNRKAWNK